MSINLAFHHEGTFVPVTYVLTFDGRKVLFLVHILLVGQHYIYDQKYIRLRCLLRVKGLEICVYLAVFFSTDKT